MHSPVLGLNFGTHDSAAALVVDGHVVAAAEEERFTREKHTKAFPAQAISYCLREAGLDAADVGRIAFFVDPRLQLGLPIANLIFAFPGALRSLGSDIRKWAKRRDALTAIQESEFFREGPRVVPVRHHLAHAASAYLTSPFDHATVITIDGRGEFETVCVFEGHGGTLHQRHASYYPHSIGYLYSAMTKYLGFRAHRDEYKVMGLAGYGGPSYLPHVSRLARFDECTGRLRLDLSFFDHHCRPSQDRSLYSRKLTRLLGPPREAGDAITDRHKDIAYAVQRLTESLVLQYVRFARTIAPSRFLCLAGGVALNGVANATIIESGLFDGVYVQPAANDAGTSVGAALHVASLEAGVPIRSAFATAFLGPSFVRDDFSAAVDLARQSGCSVEEVIEPSVVAGRLLARNLVIGWFQGRMEFGPRALGARSILASPSDSATSDRVNALVKRREMFRPLAPATIEEEASKYFNVHNAGRHVYPFMLATASVVQTQRSVLPAVVHTDGTARVQVISRETNLPFWEVVSSFQRECGLPVVLNTSFNGNDEPIVCTPVDAVRTFLAVGLDALVMGSHLITRTNMYERH